MIQTRRDIICSGLGLAGIIAAGKAPAAMVKSMLSARKEIVAGGGDEPLSAKSYVQDGLVAMWDGIENAGWGHHDANATVWKDLIGELDLTFSLDCVIEQDGVLFGASKGTAIVQNKNISPYDVEFVLQRTETSRPYSVFWYDSTDYSLGYSSATYAIGFKNLSFGQQGGYFLSPGNGGELFAIHYHKYPFPRTAYVNGSSATSSSASEAWSAFGTAVCIGGRAPGNTNNFVGRIKSVRVYSRALTAAEIAANYAVDKARFNLS